ncbi:fimbria/pilus periplasmic chaperone [Stenotrophomonas sp. CFBP 13718]|uniref:fimbria/pilus periplasmic chaperone n=1 Tax=Stenotrophomonas sp. CFBP 13718 TaxID=2775304 RepID=UPI001786543A|nr:fimbria/pilus periplasmic chaperone [Stenotrophomonas sp. CFBP 13718]MBD8695609.1 fimbria/pilus periplasmic chaperone [Stenotrophomonas sp. CFBP 13718]
MSLFRTGLTCLALASSLLAGIPAAAQVIVHGTRQIFPGAAREISVRLENVGKRASLVQAWTDDGDKQAAPETVKTPFVLRPPVFRLDPGKSQVLRLQFTGTPMPQDRESLYWLNVLDIPPAPQADEVPTGNFLQFSLRTRIKLIYRPKGLADVMSSAQKLQWSLVPDGEGWALQARNPTPYYVHLSRLALRIQGTDHPVDDPRMIEPLATQVFAVQGLNARPVGGNVQFDWINDQGGNVGQSVALED